MGELEDALRYVIERDTDSAEISCFHDYGQELALSLLYYLQIGKTIAKSDRSKEI